MAYNFAYMKNLLLDCINSRRTKKMVNFVREKGV